MTRGVHDIDPVILPSNGGVLGQNGDAAFLLEIIRVEHTFYGDPSGLQGARLL